MACQVPNYVKSKVGINLHNRRNHPLEILKKKICAYLNDSFVCLDSLPPIVSKKQNFDDLGVPHEYLMRRPSEVYYVDEIKLLRTHLAAHWCDLLGSQHNKFLLTGDCYRKEVVDPLHYPVFHQMDGVAHATYDNVANALIGILNGLIQYLFPRSKYRLNDVSALWTDPSYEYEVKWNGKWLSVATGGCIKEDVLAMHGIAEAAWVFRLDLDGLVMALFEIPDVRLLWSQDARFVDQFSHGEIKPFVAFTMPEGCFSTWRDAAFLVTEKFSFTGFCDVVRDVADHVIQRIETLSCHGNNNNVMLCYRMHYQPLDQAFTPKEIDQIQSKICWRVEQELEVICQ